MSSEINSSLWQKLWEFDPNILVVMDPSMLIRVVNPSFCSTFHFDKDEILGKHASIFMDDVSDFQRVLKNQVTLHKEKYFTRYDVTMRMIMFPLVEENLAACIMVDITPDVVQHEEMRRLKQDLIINVNNVIDKQMQIAQEIASLLGETTADAKVSLVKIRNALNEEIK
jgi:hypothetical protein